MTFDLLIHFTNGMRKVVKGVSGYGILDSNSEMFYYKKNGLRSFMPVHAVSFIGRESDFVED